MTACDLVDEYMTLKSQAEDHVDGEELDNLATETNEYDVQNNAALILRNIIQDKPDSCSLWQPFAPDLTTENARTVVPAPLFDFFGLDVRII